MAQKTLRELGIITAVFVSASAILYGYFSWFTHDGMGTVYRNWDGPAYIVVAKSFYDPRVIEALPKLPHIDRASYYAQEFPLYPMFIRVFSFMGYELAMIMVSQLFALFFIYVCYMLIKHYEPSANALVIGLLLIFYLPRWFVVSHVGSSESVFMFFLALSWLLYIRKNIRASAVALSLVILTRLAGAFFFVGFALYGLLKPKEVRSFSWYLLVPAALIGLFAVFGLQYGNMMMAIDEYGAHSITQWPPFKNFTKPEFYYDVWKEGLLLLHILYAVAISRLLEKKSYLLALTSLPYFGYLFLVHHADMSRYLLPLLPILAIAFAPALSKRSVYIPLFLFVPIVYLIAISYMSYNVMGAL